MSEILRKIGKKEKKELLERKISGKKSKLGSAPTVARKVLGI